MGREATVHIRPRRKPNSRTGESWAQQAATRAITIPMLTQLHQLQEHRKGGEGNVPLSMPYRTNPTIVPPVPTAGDVHNARITIPLNIPLAIKVSMTPIRSAIGPEIPRPIKDPALRN